MSTPEQQPGRFGEYGGRYVPETLIPALDELARAWAEARADPAYRARSPRICATAPGAPPRSPSLPA